MWSGSISFGLVNVPIKLYSAVSPKEVHFNMLHEKDGARIQQKRVCALDGEEVPWEEIAKGYEISKGRYVMIEPEELEKYNPKATKSVDIMDFVDLDSIDPIYFERTYYLAPDRGAAKAYALLVEAMKRTNKVAIAHIVLRTKQYLCALRPMENALALSTMLYADEVVDLKTIDQIPDADSKPADREIKMAEQLVESLAAEWEPEKYTDEYREQVLDLLKKKAEGEEIVVPASEDAPSKVINLVDALQASLEASRGARKGHAEPKGGESGTHRFREEDKAAARKGGSHGRKPKKKAS